MAQIGVKVFADGFSGKLLIRLMRNGAQVSISPAFDFPYDDVYVFEDISPVVYTVQLWRSVDGVILTQLIDEWSVDASKQSTTTVRTFQYLVGRGDSGTSPDWADPANEDITLTDQRIDGYTKDQIRVHEAGFGDWLDERYELLPGGGISLNDGYTFNEGTAWFITVYDTAETTIPVTSAGGMYDGVEVVGEDAEFNETLRNKLIIINAPSSRLQITFPDLTLVPDGVHCTINTHNGSQNYTVLQFNVGDTVRFCNQNVNVIYIPRCVSLGLYFDSGVCYITTPTDWGIRRGMIIGDYDATRHTDTGAFLYADEATGELNREDYEGLYEFINQLTGDAVCPLGSSLGQWSYTPGGGVFPNKRKYGIDTVSLKCRVPHLSGVSAKMTSTPGVYEADGVGPLNVEVRSGTGGEHTDVLNRGGGAVINTGLSGMDNFGTWFNNSPSGTPLLIRSLNSENTVKSFAQKPFVIL